MGGSGGVNAVLGDHAEITYGPSGIKGLVKEPYIFGLAMFASIGGVLFGYDQGVISGVLVSTNFENLVPSLTNATLKGWVTSILTLGAMFGALINGPICDRFSRRWSILYASLIFLVGSILQAATQDAAMLFVARFIVGIGVGMLSMVVPLYLSEISPPNIRGSIITLQQLGITLGICIAFWLEYGTQYIGGTGQGQSQAAWRFPLAFQCLPALLLAVGTFFLPYSPRWLMNQGREDEARQALIRVRRVAPDDHRIKLELMEIKIAQMFEREIVVAKYGEGVSKLKVTYHETIDLFTVPHLAKRTLIACLLQIIQQFTGINAIIYYAPTVFESIGLSGNSVSLLATGVVGLIDFFATIPAILFMDRWGRRKVLLIGAVGMGVAQLIVGTLLAVYRYSWAEHKGAGWAAVVFIWVYIAFFASSIGCVNWVMPAEIFPIANRGKAMGLAIAMNWLSAFIVALVLPKMLDTISFGTFYFFLAFCVILFFWVLFFVPETRGVPIEEMDRIFGGDSGHQDLQRIEAIRRTMFAETQGDHIEVASVGEEGEKGPAAVEIDEK